VTDIVLTHWHGDHCKGLPSVLELLAELYSDSKPPRIHKFRCEEHDEPIVASLGSSGAGPLRFIEDSQKLHPELTVLHTPGHTTDSISILYRTSLFSADTVLGQGTAVFEDLSSYIASLERAANFLEQESGGEKVRLLPGHGPVVDDGVAKLREYIAHRLEREKQVVDVLARSPRGLTVPESVLSHFIYYHCVGLTNGRPSFPLFPRRLVKEVYGPSLPEKLVGAAGHGLLLHLKKLEKENRVEQVGDVWRLIATKTG
jgi:ribonuclease/clavin/mitogillin